uniref:Uncharacterized protein n=1 Tax=Anguilla anguilla TaxID=7936 RepID=A0A0E9XI38_ANGAN
MLILHREETDVPKGCLSLIAVTVFSSNCTVDLVSDPQKAY